MLKSHCECATIEVYGCINNIQTELFLRLSSKGISWALPKNIIFETKVVGIA